MNKNNNDNSLRLSNNNRKTSKILNDCDLPHFIKSKENAKEFNKIKDKIYLEEFSFLKQYIDNNEYDSSVLGIFGKWGIGKSSLVKLVQNKITSNDIQNRKSLFIWINVWNLSDKSDNKQISLKKKVIKEMHNFLFEKANERLAHGKRIDFTSDDIEYKQKKRLKNIRIGLFLFTVFWACILITMLSLILVFKEYSIVSGLGLFTIAFTSIWGQYYYNEQKSAKIMKMSVLDTNYDYENHMLLLLKKLEKSDKVKRIIFVFHGLEQLISSELYDVLNSIRVFLNKKNIKYIILIDEKNCYLLLKMQEKIIRLVVIVQQIILVNTLIIHYD